MFSRCKTAIAATVLGASQFANALYFLHANDQSARDVAAQIAGDLMKQYYINAPIQGIGQLPRPYYWWEAGATWGALVTYYSYTGDWSLNDIVGKAILSQASPTVNFMPVDQDYDLGNDDQVVWALTAMEAAEHNYPVPTELLGQYPSDIWYQLANNAWDSIQKRWDTSSCNGGVRWQIFSSNSGYTYKSSIANAGLFQLSARLARYTGDPDGKYQNMASKVYSWMKDTGLIYDDGSVGEVVFDGATTTTNCKDVDEHRWTYNAGAVYLGAEYLASLGKSQAATWGPIATSLFHGIQNTFLNFQGADGIMIEINCEPYGSCNNDQMAFKALMMRWFAKVTQVSVAPYTNALIMSYMAKSATAAANTCNGGSTGTLCGNNWIPGAHGEAQGVGQQISALEAVQGLLVSSAPIGTMAKPVKRDTVSAKFSKRGQLTARDYMEMSAAKRSPIAQ